MGVGLAKYMLMASLPTNGQGLLEEYYACNVFRFLPSDVARTISD
jgi:hypothetical protein